MRSVNIRLGKREGILNQLEARRRPFRKDHLNNIETKQDVRIIQQAQPGETAAGNPLSLVPMDRLERPAEIFPRPRFHFDENERVAIAADKIDLAAGPAAEITVQDFVTAPLQELAG